ncbi:tRNA A-37 threonylcarbamoyl transferase component Bud32 [Pararhizobium capsulatum DSM 1112]|uniref:tRNA A-37 threonylcarbamoyl transferase component Bud32 n=1 Tax=Pararhizobium capsulatum DSM 1112 TaxID=1121113 RepID=A0ABU0BLN5_9HYPH|nr:serine/threonine protein phosphatase [Pararhizobium capsulatum]MDQ0318365.1 tRNA A-37 threonylcarbamoyl transferase component Bud32 [Pararhizobium capsulatum DSM 1112]
MLPELKDDDIGLVLATLAGGTDRVQRVTLSDQTVWVKRYARLGPRFRKRILWLLARLLRQSVLRPAPLLNAQGMVEREIRRIENFTATGFLTPTVLYRNDTTLVLSHLGQNVLQQMNGLAKGDPVAHGALLVRCGLELGRLHAAGLCHGRPHPRDFVLDGDAFGFLDFEEEPDAVMRLATTQARDIWLLFLQVASRCLHPETPAAVLEAWRSHRPEHAEIALGQIVPFFSRLLPFARFAARLRAGKDIMRFISATDFLRSATMTTLAHYYSRTQGRTE